MNGKEVVFLSSFKDYRTVGGIQFPFRIESQAKGNENRQEIVITRVELDTPIDDARFALPHDAGEAGRERQALTSPGGLARTVAAGIP